MSHTHKVEDLLLNVFHRLSYNPRSLPLCHPFMTFHLDSSNSLLFPISITFSFHPSCISLPDYVFLKLSSHRVTSLLKHCQCFPAVAKINTNPQARIQAPHNVLSHPGSSVPSFRTNCSKCFSTQFPLNFSICMLF